ncbi:hypothetical protein MNBD_GAMMA12-1480 [hydrothermal vent metagenome]|uniref:Sulfurtransferase n=1 Tax=hydrothermal vent metagenome TaxID=652676 RepID=A0A3B0Y9M9_9ZZZZ
MADILSILSNQDNKQMDPDGRLLSLPAWSTRIAADLAKAHGLELTTQHINVLNTLRGFYCEQKDWRHPRETLKVLEQACGNGSNNSRKELYQLFPDGPVREACMLAGLPIPHNSSNPSFGSVL